MWLLPIFHRVAALAARLYYRLTVAGESVPGDGPVLLVANHPNGLLDPVLLAAAAARPVRLLAKAPLFDDPRIGWLIRAAGAIPVYRRSDDPASTSRNVATFDAVERALVDDAAVGLFPEGRSHSEPEIGELKTGAARMVLGAARLGVATAVVPVGLVFRRKEEFRSRALALVGSAVDWSDLEGRGPDDREAVSQLTRRLEAALRAVTINTDAWEDRPLVESAEAIWVAELGGERDPAARVGRLAVATAILARVRARPDPSTAALARDLSDHVARLEELGLRPAHLSVRVGPWTTAAWVARHLHLPVVLLLAVAATIVFWVPYRLTDVLVSASDVEDEVRSTYTLLAGIVVYLAWAGLVGGVGAWLGGWRLGTVTLAVLPALGVAGLWALERGERAWGEVKRFVALVGDRARLDALRSTQRELASRLAAVSEAAGVTSGSSPAPRRGARGARS